MAQIVRLTTKPQQSGQKEAAQAAEQLSLLSEELLKHLPGEARYSHLTGHTRVAKGSATRHHRRALAGRFNHVEPYADCCDLGRHPRIIV